MKSLCTGGMCVSFNFWTIIVVSERMCFCVRVCCMRSFGRIIQRRRSTSTTIYFFFCGGGCCHRRSSHQYRLRMHACTTLYVKWVCLERKKNTECERESRRKFRTQPSTHPKQQQQLQFPIKMIYNICASAYAQAHKHHTRTCMRACARAIFGPEIMDGRPFSVHLNCIETKAFARMRNCAFVCGCLWRRKTLYVCLLFSRLCVCLLCFDTCASIVQHTQTLTRIGI